MSDPTFRRLDNAEDAVAERSFAPSLHPGELIAGRFRVVRYLARGGVGEVYEAEDQELANPVALKVLRPELAEARESIERLKRETAMARAITHPNVCRIFDVFRHRQGERVLVGLSMELLRGETLAERLARRGRLQPDEALPLAVQMAHALAAAHDADVVHRDFKTANVMLVPRADGGGERVVVTDFGLALAAPGSGIERTRLTVGNAIPGTADYIAPELLRGDPITRACDIYALGVVLFEMVTGARPFEADSQLAGLLRRLHSDAPAPRRLAPELPRHWEVTILRCLERRPAARPARALEVAAALEQQPGTSGAVIRYVRPPTRRLLKRGGLALIAACAAAVVLGVLRHLDRDAGRPGVPAMTQLTTWTGLEVDPCFSPDGRSLAFSANQTGMFEIFVLPLQPGAQPLRLTSDDRQNFQPAWSPDGAWIAYASHGRGGIWLLPASGGSPRRLTEHGSHPAWSPDGYRLAFQSETSAELSANAVHALPPSTLWVVDANGSNPHRVTTAGQPPGGHGAPAWSPDGRRLVFAASERRTSQIWSLNLATGAVSPLVRDPPVVFDPAPDIDGRGLYYAAIGEGERHGVWRMPLAGASSAGPPMAVASLGAASLRQFHLSPDGRRMAVTALATVSNLWSLPLSARGEPSGPPVPLTAGSGRNSRPSFSPDGATIAFDRWRVGTNQDVWLMASDGSDPRPLTVSTETDTQASWLPGGAGIAFLGTRDGSDRFVTRPLGDGDEEVVLTLPLTGDAPRLSPDGSRVVYHAKGEDGSVNLWVARTDGSGARQITFDDELMGYGCWSPDGRSIGFEMRRGESDHVMVIDADGGTPIQLTQEPGKSWPYSFSPDGDQIVFAGLRKGRWDLYAVSRSTREVRRLTQLEQAGVYLRYPAWSPRGDRIVFERAETGADLWVLEGLR